MKIRALQTDESTGQPLPAVWNTRPGVRWRLADAGWLRWALRADRALAADLAGVNHVELLKRTDRRLVFRLTSRDHRSSVVVKCFRMVHLRQRVFYHGRYARTEASNLLEAARLGLPVPKVYGWCRRSRLGLVSYSALMTEDLSPRRTAGRLLAQAEGDRGRQDAILDASLGVFLALHRVGCNHIDLNPESILLREDLSDTRVVDFHYARFLGRPSPTALMCQASRFVVSCPKMVSRSLFDEWAQKLIVAAGLDDPPHWLGVYREFIGAGLTRRQRLRLR